MRTIKHLVAAVLVVSALALAPVATAPPASADPSDTNLNPYVLSPQYNLNGCLYRVAYGNFGASAPFALAHFYNLGSCGLVAVSVVYTTPSGRVTTIATGVVTSGTDGCGAYQVIQATGGPGTAIRAAVFAAGTGRVYAADGLNTQPIHATC